MKIAALYDIHGNLPALDAVLTELRQLQPDLIVVGGDIVSGPMPAQTLERLRQAGSHVQFIQGNGDREIVATIDGKTLKRRFLPEASELEFETKHWIARQFSPAQRDFLAAMPAQISHRIEGLGDILFCHATVRNDEEIFTPLTPEARLKTLFAGVTQDIIVCGHTHSHFELQLDTRRILNAGSVGMPYADQPGAYWLLLGPDGHEFKYTSYDIEAAANEVLASGYPDAQAFVEENMRKLPTAREAMEYFENLARTLGTTEG